MGQVEKLFFDDAETLADIDQAIERGGHSVEELRELMASRAFYAGRLQEAA
jgi:hypothetical protein